MKRGDAAGKYNPAVDEPIHPQQLAALKRLTPAQKLRMLDDLFETGVRLRMAGVRMQHPDWPEEKIEREVRASLRRAHT